MALAHPKRPTRQEVEARWLPLIEAARAEAGPRRDAAWLDVPEAIAGLRVRALTLADYLALALSGNAYVAEVAAPEVAAEAAAFWAGHGGVFLWRMSPGYVACETKMHSWQVHNRVADLDVAEVHAGICDYLRRTFADRPQPVVEAGTAAVPLSVAASFAAAWVHDFATAYGWTDEHTLSRPLARIFQLRQLLRIEATLTAGKQPLPAGDEADVLAARCFAEIQALEESA